MSARTSDVPEKSKTSRRFRAALTSVVAALVVALGLPAPTASADPSASQWQRLRMCESSNNYKINTGNGYYGAYQFDLSTWQSVGGKGYPYQASAAEQDARALILYRMRGWQPWECAGKLGFVNDSDAKSKYIADIKIGSGNSGGSGGGSGGGSSYNSTAYPGYQLKFGQTSAALKKWQLQMKAKGAPLTGTGYFGPATQKVVNQLQQQNGLCVCGFIGPKTWKAAWSGKYSASGTAKPATPPKKPSTAPKKSATSAKAPSAPASALQPGQYSESLKKWQLQMKKRGAALTGTGYFGPETAKVVKSLQKQNKLNVVGYIGVKTWYAAWNGKYTA